MSERIMKRKVFVILLACMFSINAEMTKNIWWINSHDQYVDRPNTSCKMIHNSPSSKMVALLTLTFNRTDGMLPSQLDFINLIALKIGDSLGMSFMVSTGFSEYTMQYGQSTGIIADVKYKCYAPKKKPLEIPSSLKDTPVITSTLLIVDVIASVIVTEHDTLSAFESSIIRGEKEITLNDLKCGSKVIIAYKRDANGLKIATKIISE